MIDNILGPWVVDIEDKNSIEKLGHVLLNFSKEGILRYSIFHEEKEEVIIMTYKIYDDIIEPSQPSNPNSINKTKFVLNINKLDLYFKGEVSKFIRVP